MHYFTKWFLKSKAAFVLFIYLLASINIAVGDERQGVQKVMCFVCARFCTQAKGLCM